MTATPHQIELSSRAFQQIRLTGVRLSGAQRQRLNQLVSNHPRAGLERNWSQSLAEAVVGGYFVADDALTKMTDLVSIDNEGYLYFDGIRGDNVGNGVQPVLISSNYLTQAHDFEMLCLHSLLAGYTVQQRHLVANRE